jgi:mRNA interferase MazF
MKEGDVAIAALVQANGQFKNRPVVILRSMPPFGDFLVCGASSQLHQAIPNFDEVIGPSDSDFTGSGLKSTSVIRLEFLATLPIAYLVASGQSHQTDIAACWSGWQIICDQQRAALSALREWVFLKGLSVALEPGRIAAAFAGQAGRRVC